MYVCILIKICTLSNGMAPQVQCMYIHACILHTHAYLLTCTHSNEVVPPVQSPSETSVRRGGGGGPAGEPG